MIQDILLRYTFSELEFVDIFVCCELCFECLYMDLFLRLTVIDDIMIFCELCWIVRVAVAERSEA